MGAVADAVERVQVHDDPSVMIDAGPPLTGPVDDVLVRIRAEADRLAGVVEGIAGRDWQRCARLPSGRRASAMDLVRHAVHVGTHHRHVVERVMATVLLGPNSSAHRRATE